MSLDGTTSRWIDELDPDDGEEQERTAPGWRSRLLLLAASVPWLVVIALLVLPARLGADGPADDGEQAPHPTSEEHGQHGDGDAQADTEGAALPTGSSPAHPGGPPEHAVDGDTPAGAPAGGGQGTPGASASTDGFTELDLMEVRGAWRVEPGPEEAAALGIVIARSWLTTLDPPLEIAGLSAPAGLRYAEHLVVEAVERPTPDTVVVTVLAVVLEGDPTLEAQVRRLAVPIVWDDHLPRAGGPPWDLPAPDLTAEALPVSDAVDDVDEGAALAALQAAGYLEVELVDLAASDAGIVVAEIRARTADGTAVEGPVWLRRHLDGLVLAGSTLAGGGGS